MASDRFVEAQRPTRTTIGRIGRSSILLLRAALARASRRGAWYAALAHVVAPAGAVAFVALMGADLTRDGRWPLLAIAVIVWLLFVNGVLHGGMTLWHERWLLEGSGVPTALVVVTASALPLIAAGLQLAVLAIAIELDSAPFDAADLGLLLPAAIALTAGTGTGMLAARCCTVYARLSAWVPAVAVATLVLTPVFYPASALGGADDARCTINPLCTAVELARGDITPGASAVPGHRTVIAIATSVIVLAWGFTTTRTRRARAGRDEQGVGIRMRAARTGTPRSAAHGIRRVGALIREAVGIRDSGYPTPARGPALSDLDLYVGPGEIAAVIGQPGSGQRPILELAAGLRRPAGGQVHTGAASSLVDARDGAHSALTGRENAALLALLDGWPRAEARRRADAAVELAGLDQRADVRVARYSDQERIRLGFATLIALGRPVAVWDDDVLGRYPEFRQTCLARVPAMIAEGRTLLIASTDLGKLEEISPRAVWIQDGQVVLDGATAAVLDRYLEPRFSPAPLAPSGDSECRIVGVRLQDGNGDPAVAQAIGTPFTVVIDVDATHAIDAPHLVLGIAGPWGPVTGASTFLDGRRPTLRPGINRIECRVDSPPLAPRHPFTIRFAVYAADGVTILCPKRVIASFVTGGTAATLGYAGAHAAHRVFGSPPVVSRYAWRFPDEPEPTSPPGRGPIGGA